MNTMNTTASEINPILASENWYPVDSWKEEVDITEIGLTDLNAVEYEELMELKDRYWTDVNGMDEEEKKRFLNQGRSGVERRQVGRDGGQVLRTWLN
jgi:hypothetical protein